MAADLAAAETRLWAAANQLWANTGLRQTDFSEPGLGLIFLRYADKRFDEAHAALLDGWTCLKTGHSRQARKARAVRTSRRSSV